MLGSAERRKLKVRPLGKSAVNYSKNSNLCEHSTPNVTDRQTDGRTDRQTDRELAIAIPRSS